MSRAFGVALLVGLLSGSLWAAEFGDIPAGNWVGTGANQTGLIITWDDGKTPDPVLFGYRWDGAGTTEDMLRAIAAADKGLFVKVDTDTPYGTALTGLGYNCDGDVNWGISDGSIFTAGVTDSPRDLADGHVSTDADDHYREGWWTGYWNQLVKNPGDTEWGWGSGASYTSLVNDGWQSYSYVALPEPATAGLVAGAVVLLARRRRVD